SRGNRLSHVAAKVGPGLFHSLGAGEPVLRLPERGSVLPRVYPAGIEHGVTRHPFRGRDRDRGERRAVWARALRGWDELRRVGNGRRDWLCDRLPAYAEHRDV